MLDRSVQFPQRYQLKKVEGTEDIFDLIPAPGEVSAEGTLINKATLWRDATAALFGLGVDSVPNDGFAYLGKYAQHWWRRRTPEQKIAVKSDITERVVIGTSVDGVTVQHAKDVTISEEGALSLASPTTYTKQFTSSSAALSIGNELAGFAPCYLTGFSGNKTQVYFLPAGSTAENTPSGNKSATITCSSSTIAVYGDATITIKCQSVSVQSGAGDWVYLQSSDRSAYPDSGEQDGYEYEYLGIPFDNAVGAPKIETGSYVGTGTYGASNPNSLTFGFVPKLVIVTGSEYMLTPSNDSWYNGIVWTPGVTDGKVRSQSGYNVKLNASFNKLNWYSTDGSEYNQLNSNGSTYHYFAIG